MWPDIDILPPPQLSLPLSFECLSVVCLAVHSLWRALPRRLEIFHDQSPSYSRQRLQPICWINSRLGVVCVASRNAHAPRSCHCIVSVWTEWNNPRQKVKSPSNCRFTSFAGLGTHAAADHRPTDAADPGKYFKFATRCAVWCSSGVDLFIFWLSITHSPRPDGRLTGKDPSVLCPWNIPP